MTWGSNRMHFTYDSLGPASVTYNGNRYFYLKNAQGDVTGLVNASGTQVVSYTYDPWGAPMSTGGTMSSTLGAANPLRYRGYVYDTETGFYTELPMNGFEIDADMFSVEASASLSSKKVSIGAGAYVARASVLIYIPLDISVSIGVYVGPGFSFGYGEKGFGFSASSLIGFSFAVCWDDD